MSILRRYYSDNQIYFVTAVTLERERILENNYDILLFALNRSQEILPFELIAYVFLPDHIHLLINPGKNNLSDIIHRIKMFFNGNYRKRHKLKSGQIWQRRFWDHIIRDEIDLKNHFDYIHCNPIKHGLVKMPGNWDYSTFNKYLGEGYYNKDWGSIEVLKFEGEFGEYE